MPKIFVFLASIFFVIGQIFLIPKNQTLQSQEVNVQSEQEQEELEILEEDENLEEDDLVQEDIQDQPDQNLNLENDEDIEKVVVSSDRLKQKSKELTAAHTIITRDEIEQSGAQTLEDVLQASPGLYVRESTGRGADTVFSVRGSGSFNNVLLLVDGMPVNDSSGYFSLGSIPVDAIERVEIIRGNQTAIYGGAAVSGVINIITRKGKPGAYFLGHAIGGRYAMHDLGFGFSGAGKIEGGQSYRVFAYSRYMRTDGFEEAGGQAGHKNINLSSEFMFSEYSRLSLYGSYTDRYFEYLPTPLVEKYDYNARTNSNLGISYRHLLFDFYEPVIDFNYFVTSRNYKWSTLTDNFKRSGLLLNFKNNFYLFEGKNVLALGFEYGFDEFYLKTDKYGKNRDKKTIYANNLLRLGGLTVSLAGRIDFWKSTIRKTSWDKDLFHWKGALAYQIINQPQSSVSLIKPFFNIAQGKIAPTLTALAWSQKDELKPETIFMLDSGVQSSFFQDQLDFTATFFYHDIKDKVMYSPKPPFATFNTNQKSTGFELDLKASIGYGFLVRGSYTYQDITPPKNDIEGKTINPQILPKNTFKTSLNWNGWRPLNVNIALISIGQRNYSPNPNKLEYLPNYEIVNFAASYQVMDEFKLFIHLNNLFNKRYHFNKPDKLDSYGFNIWGGIKFNLSLL